MDVKRLRDKLEQVAEAFNCDFCNDSSQYCSMSLSELDQKTGQNKWKITFDYTKEKGMTIESSGLNYFDHHIKNFPVTAIDKDVVDLSQHFQGENALGIKRTEVNFISDKTIDVVKLVVEKDANGLHVELIESRDSTDFSILLSDHFGCDVPAIDDDGFQHYLIKQSEGEWRVSTPEIGTWTQETLHNALTIDYNFAEQLLHFTFYNKEVQLVQRSNVAIRKIEVEGESLVFHSVKRNKQIRLTKNNRLTMQVNY